MLSSEARTSTINQLAEARELAVAEGDADTINVLDCARPLLINLGVLTAAAEEILINLGLRD